MRYSDPAGIALPADYIETTKQIREQLALRLKEIEAQISQLNDEKRQLFETVSAMDAIPGVRPDKDRELVERNDPLELSDEHPASPDATPRIPSALSYGDHTRRRNSSAHSDSVDAVVEVLRSAGPLHYRDILVKVGENGVSVRGKDPAATLLARFSRDSRIHRVGYGTYDIAPNV